MARFATVEPHLSTCRMPASVSLRRHLPPVPPDAAEPSVVPPRKVRVTPSRFLLRSCRQIYPATAPQAILLRQRTDEVAEYWSIGKPQHSNTPTLRCSAVPPLPQGRPGPRRGGSGTRQPLQGDLRHGRSGGSLLVLHPRTAAGKVTSCLASGRSGHRVMPCRRQWK